MGYHDKPIRLEMWVCGPMNDALLDPLLHALQDHQKDRDSRTVHANRILERPDFIQRPSLSIKLLQIFTVSTILSNLELPIQLPSPCHDLSCFSVSSNGQSFFLAPSHRAGCKQTSFISVQPSPVLKPQLPFSVYFHHPLPPKGSYCDLVTAV